MGDSLQLLRAGVVSVSADWIEGVKEIERISLGAGLTVSVSADWIEGVKGLTSSWKNSTITWFQYPLIGSRG